MRKKGNDIEGNWQDPEVRSRLNAAAMKQGLPRPFDNRQDSERAADRVASRKTDPATTRID